MYYDVNAETGAGTVISFSEHSANREPIIGYGALLPAGFSGRSLTQRSAKASKALSFSSRRHPSPDLTPLGASTAPYT